MRIRFNALPGAVLIQEQFLIKKLELAQVKKQIEVLATFMPDEILQLKLSSLQDIHNYVGVLLFADVSGFTPLTEKYNKTGKGGIYRLTATLNAYIGAIVEVLYFYGGDVLKFSGDAFLALWKVKPDDSLFEILHEVVVCALVIQQTLGRFETEVNVLLKVKLAISCGNMTFSVIGDDTTKHYIIVGDAVNDVKAAEHASVSGDVVISPGAWTHMLQERYEITEGEGGNVKVWKVFYKPNEEDKKLYYEQKQFEVQKLCESHINHRNLLHKQKNFDSNLTDSKITEHFVGSLPPRVEMKAAPRNWIVDDLKPFIIKPVQNQVDESQPVEYLTEMREVTIQFINIIPTTYYEPILVNMVDNAYRTICNIVGEVLGVVNKVSLFDKDIMILVLFGLRGVKHEMESQNALKSGFRIRLALMKLKGAQSVSIGITNGFVYCGVVGHPMRREYTVIGGAVNKAARMMCTYPEKVTCDHKTFKHSKLSSFYFQLQSVLRLKGIEEVGSIFEYNEYFDSPNSAHQDHVPIIGRTMEIDFLRKIIYKPTEVHNYYGVCIHGPPKIGKTKLLRSTLDNFRTEEELKHFSLASVELATCCKIPYFTVSRIYRQLYDEKAKIHSEEFFVLRNLPRDLYNQDEFTINFKEDIAKLKYKILNTFRDVIRFSEKEATIIFIDNMHHIDLQSWEILEIVIKDRRARLIMTAFFEEATWDLQFKISLNDYIHFFELGPIDNKFIAALACQFLNACGIPVTLVTLLVKSVEGRPGFVQKCLLRLVNNGSIELTLISTSEEDHVNFAFPSQELLGRSRTDLQIIPIIELSEKYKNKNDELTLAAISLDLFDSFTPYQQLVIKTGSVLGEVFTRDLLMVTLKYPSEITLAKVMKQLFEEEVFDCGSRYVYANDIDTQKVCCICYFDEDFFLSSDSRSTYPKYAYCKIIHFKNKSIRDVAYDLLPGNQRKELHLRCADVLEEMKNHCPYCLRDPNSNYYRFPKFKEVMIHCNDINTRMKKVSKSKIGKEANIKKVIRACINSEIKPSRGNNVLHINTPRAHIRRVIWDPTRCQCLEILNRVYQDLIYHSERAGHLGKLIFFTMIYGHICTRMGDFYSGVIYLSEARELCMINARTPNSQISEMFRRIHTGKIETLLAKCNLSLRQLNTARSHLALALRQYSIPSVSLTYKVFSSFLNRSYLSKMKRIKPFYLKNTMIRNDLGQCLLMCGQLFSIEGNWHLAKLACNYAVFLLKTVNINIPILFDSYATAIDIYRHCYDLHMCEKLQKRVIREMQINYADDRTVDMLAIISLVASVFEIKCLSGEIKKCIRLGYRVLELCYKVNVPFWQIRVIEWLALLLLYNFRLKDCVDIMKLCNSNTLVTSQVNYAMWFYSDCLGFYLLSGFISEPIDKIISFAELYFDRKKTAYAWRELLFLARIHTHYLRLGKYLIAMDWKHQVVLNRSNCQNEIVMKILLATVETCIMEFLHNKKIRKPNIDVDEKVIDGLLHLLEYQSKKHFKCFRPCSLYLFAWFAKIQHKHSKANKLLRKGEEMSRKQENYLYYSFGKQLQNYWKGGFSYKYCVRPDTNYEQAEAFTLIQWAQFMHSYPLE